MQILENSLTNEEVDNLKQLALKARSAILHMTTLAASGHPGGSMSTLDMLLTLYKIINVDPTNPKKEDRDIVIVSHGHVSPAVYSTLALNGFFKLDDAVSQFRLAGSIFEGHIEPDVPGVEWATGNLGQGLSAGIGFALAKRVKNLPGNVYVLMGDGEQQKGQLAEARRFAVKYNLTNLIAFVDYNGLQISGKTTNVMPQNIKDNYLSDGWNIIEIDGHNYCEIQQAIIEAQKADKPTVIIANTVMGKSVSFMENKEKYHGSAISEEQLVQALQELGQENKLDYYKKLRNEFIPKVNHSAVPADFTVKRGNNILYDKPNGNREAWGNALADIANLNKNDLPFAVFDCDLAGSVKTDGFAKVLPENFFQGGIMEHNTATIAGAMSKEGVQVFFADFGVFGVDETYNQHRLNDINKTNLKIVTTHVGLDVGEDGKTHQCIDYIGVMRNLYNFKIIIPACPDQTDHIIRYAAGKWGNYLIPMGRSKIASILNENGQKYFDANYNFVYGKADLLRRGSKAAIFATGAVVEFALEVVKKLEAENLDVTLYNLSSPCEIDEEALRCAASTGIIFTYEDHNVNTGIGALIAQKIVDLELKTKLIKFGVTDYQCSGSAKDVFRRAGLDAETVAEKIRKVLAG
ncbi:MAG: transketolase [Candidatus Cloacimonetes bacterium]|nr:transketolase [Candidatus Cloacimonadota bacterium]